MLGVTLSKNARARAVQLPAWNEALGLPRPWDQQWSLRLQQVLAFESDLLEYDDIFDGSHVIEAKVAELVEGAQRRDRPGPGDGRRDRRRRVRLHEAGAGLLPRRPPGPDRVRRGDDRRRQQVYETTEPSPLTADLDAAIMAADPEAEKAALRERRGVEGRARRGRGRRGAGDAGRGRQDRHQPDGRHPGRRPRRRDDGGVGRRRCARCSASSARPTGVSGAVGVAEAGAELTAVRERVQADRRGARRPAAAARRQARARRALQRRRAGRRTRSRRRLRGDLPGHPADAGADRGRGRRRGRALRRPLDPVRLAHGAGARRPRRPARGRARATCR